MKDFQILPLDTSMENLEGRAGFNHYQVLNLEQTQRLFSRLRVGEWAKTEAFATIGITPQRLGSVAASETATGTQAAVNNSYSQTETYFTTHINFIMPRVREMMVNAAQYFQSNNPSLNLQYTTANDENIMFSLDGARLLARDIQVYTHFKPDAKAVLDQMKQLILQNNTSGANIYDLLKIVAANTPSEVVDAAKKSVEDFNNQTQQKQQHEQEMMQKQIEAKQQELAGEREFEAGENDKDRQTKITEATIKAMGFSQNNDINTNEVPDILEIDKFNAQLGQFQEKLMMDKEKMYNDKNIEERKLSVKEQELLTKRDIAEKQLEIARENKTNAELKKDKSNKK
jgi:hypothetical protein